MAAYWQATRALHEALDQRGVLQQVFPAPIGAVPGIVLLHLRITELLVHGWDLAHATRAGARLSDDLVLYELEFTRSKLANVPADRHPFAPTQPVTDDAPAIDQLAACLGRRVGG